LGERCVAKKEPGRRKGKQEIRKVNIKGGGKRNNERTHIPVPGKVKCTLLGTIRTMPMWIKRITRRRKVGAKKSEKAAFFEKIKRITKKKKEKLGIWYPE